MTTSLTSIKPIDLLVLFHFLRLCFFLLKLFLKLFWNLWKRLIRLLKFFLKEFVRFCFTIFRNLLQTFFTIIISYYFLKQIMAGSLNQFIHKYFEFFHQDLYQKYRLVFTIFFPLTIVKNTTP